MFELFFQGGTVMFFLFLCSAVGVYIIVHKFIYLNIHVKPTKTMIKKSKSLLQSQGKNATQQSLQQQGVLVSSVISRAIDLVDQDSDQLQNGIKASTNQEIPKLEKNIPILSSIITIAPILGLMGTVLGLIEIFNVISGGGIGDTQALSGGIAQALISTVTGLGIAIPFILFHHYLTHRIDAFIIDIERITLDIVHYCKNNPIEA